MRKQKFVYGGGDVVSCVVFKLSSSAIEASQLRYLCGVSAPSPLRACYKTLNILMKDADVIEFRHGLTFNVKLHVNCGIVKST